MTVFMCWQTVLALIFPCIPCKKLILKSFFISPILDMERLILDMMRWAEVSEDELAEKEEIPTDFGETLSWKYFCYVREHPISWEIPT